MRLFEPAIFLRCGHSNWMTIYGKEKLVNPQWGVEPVASSDIWN